MASLFFLVASLIATPASAQSIIYVDEQASGENSGTSWTNAYTNLQDALSAAHTGNEEIWIAEGVYMPGEKETDRFTITGDQDGIAIYGGFQSGDRFEDRNPQENITVLSGNINNKDETNSHGITVTADKIEGPNSYNVLFLDGTVGDPITKHTIIDGLVVTGGQANGTQRSQRRGAGLFCNGENHKENACNPILSNVTFAGNRASESGGAIYNNGMIRGESSPQIIDATFSGNAAERGGAIFNEGTSGTSSPQITNTTFSANVAVNGHGGAIYNNGQNGTSSPTITNATFSANLAELGGAVFNDGSHEGTSASAITNTILWGNIAFEDGIQIYNNAAHSTIRHSILEGGSDGIGGQLSDFDHSGMSFDRSSNLDKDPNFVNAFAPAGADGLFATHNDGLRVRSNSPALNAGTNDATGLSDANTDRIGMERIRGEAVSMGAYEHPFDDCLLIHVNAHASGVDDGTSFENGFTNLQDAFRIAQHDDVILIGGIYTPLFNPASQCTHNRSGSQENTGIISQSNTSM